MEGSGAPSTAAQKLPARHECTGHTCWQASLGTHGEALCMGGRKWISAPHVCTAVQRHCRALCGRHGPHRQGPSPGPRTATHCSQRLTSCPLSTSSSARRTRCLQGGRVWGQVQIRRAPQETSCQGLGMTRCRGCGARHKHATVTAVARRRNSQSVLWPKGPARHTGVLRAEHCRQGGGWEVGSCE